MNERVKFIARYLQNVIEKFRVVEDDVDTAVPVDAQNAPTRELGKLPRPQFSTASTSIIFLLEKEKRNGQSAWGNHPQVWELATVLPMSPACFVTYVSGRTLRHAAITSLATTRLRSDRNKRRG